MLLRRVPAQKYRYETYQGRQRPSTAQHRGHRYGPHDSRILQRSDYRVVPIDADAAEMQDGCCAEVNVHRVPNVAHDISQQPLAAG